MTSAMFSLLMDTSFKSGVHTQISWRAKKCVAHTKGPNCYVIPMQMVHLSRKEPKSTKFWALRAKLKAPAGHIWPAGRMLCMPVLN